MAFEFIFNPFPAKASIFNVMIDEQILSTLLTQLAIFRQSK
jgi:hypothetical protein